MLNKFQQPVFPVQIMLTMKLVLSLFYLAVEWLFILKVILKYNSFIKVENYCDPMSHFFSLKILNLRSLFQRKQKMYVAQSWPGWWLQAPRAGVSLTQLTESRSFPTFSFLYESDFTWHNGSIWASTIPTWPWRKQERKQVEVGP